MPCRPTGRSAAVNAGAVALVTACGIPAFQRIGEPPRDSDEQAVPMTPTICLLAARRVAPVCPPSTLHWPSSGRYLIGWPSSVFFLSSKAISAPREASRPSDRSGPLRTSNAPIRIGWPFGTVTTPTSSVTGPAVSARTVPASMVVASAAAAKLRRSVGRSGFVMTVLVSNIPACIAPVPMKLASGVPIGLASCTSILREFRAT